MDNYRLWVFLFFLGVASSSGQEKALSGGRTLRLLAVGDAPAFSQEIRDGVRHELPPPEGSVPPSRVELSAANSDGEEQKSEYELKSEETPGLRLKLNQVSRRLKVPEAEVVVRLLDGKEALGTPVICLKGETICWCCGGIPR